MEQYLCIDIGGTTIHYALISYDGSVIKRFPSEKSRIVNGTTTIVKSVIRAIDHIQHMENISGIAICTAGVVDPVAGEIIYSGYTIPGYQGTKWKQLIEDKFNIKCEVENDVNCFLLGEKWLGAMMEVDNGIGLTIGTGIGGSILLYGDIYHGVNGFAGEIGYMNVNGQNFQDIASATYLIKEVKRRTSLNLDGREIFDYALKGNKAMLESIEALVDNLSAGIINLIYLYNPEKIVLGGGIMSQKDFLLPLLNESLKSQIQNEFFLDVEIVFSDLGEEANMLGALNHFYKINNKNS